MDLKERYKEELLKSIPVVSGMKIKIHSLNKTSVSLYAPLLENINYEGTAFGGSLNTLCILSSYLLTRHLVRQLGMPLKSLVIQNSEIAYRRPVETDFLSIAHVDEADVQSFTASLSRRKVGRINVNSFIRSGRDEEKKVVFSGRFVAKIE